MACTCWSDFAWSATLIERTESAPVIHFFTVVPSSNDTFFVFGAYTALSLGHNLRSRLDGRVTIQPRCRLKLMVELE